MTRTSMAITLAAVAALAAGAASAQGAGRGSGQWAKVGELGSRVTFIDTSATRGSGANMTAVTLAVSKTNTDIAGEETRWAFDCRARTYHATGYRDVETDFSMGEFDDADEPVEPIVAGSMVDAISQSVCDSAESDEIHGSIAEAVASARAN